MASESTGSGLIQLTGLWLNEGKRGKFMSGSLGAARILVFRNTHKTDPKHPDYLVYIAPKKRESATDQAPAGGAPRGGDAPF